LVLLAWAQQAPAQLRTPIYREVRLPSGVTLHLMEEGRGPTVIFVHGSTSDYTYWEQQIGAFAQRYHVVAYSRRYNFPNDNPPVSGYSAVMDADDLAQLIQSLGHAPVFVIGHSYGALTALFLAARHPELLRAAVLAEPPVISLLRELSGSNAARGKAIYADIQQRMVVPMNDAFTRGDEEGGLAAFMAYVLNDPNAWAKMSLRDKVEAIRDAREFEVIFPHGTLFPELPVEALRRIQVPMLLMSGARSYPFLSVIDTALVKLLPNSEHIIYPDVGHQMWLLRPELCRRDAERFFQRHGGPAADGAGRHVEGSMN